MAYTSRISVLVFTLLSGCGLFGRAGSPDESVQALTTDRSEYAPGAEVQLTLHNVFGDRIGYNLCTSQLERAAGAGWEPVQEDRVCTMELRMLGVGEEATYPLALPDDLPPGTYRYATRIEMSGEGDTESGMERLTSNEFRVQS